MDFIYIINKILKNFFISLLTCFVMIKIVNNKNNNIKRTIILTLMSLINGMIYVFLIEYLNKPFTIYLVYLLFGIIISRVIKEKIFFVSISTFLSFAITSFLYIVSIVIASAIIKTLIPKVEINNILILITTIIIEVILLYFLFKVKRLKNGFAFLNDKEKLNDIGIITIVLTGIMITIIYYILGESYGHLTRTFFIILDMIGLIFFLIWIRRKITKYYKQKLKEQTVEELTNEIKEKDELIIKISEENKALATINHKYSSRIKALENFASKISVKPEIIEKFNTEFGLDFAEINNQISNLSKEYSEEIDRNIKINNSLTKTGVFGIDSLLEYMNSEAIKNNIKFNLKVNVNINEMIQTVIPKNKLETLLGDHIKDAIIAINSSEETNKEILLEIGKTNKYYEIAIYDTGIEFEIDTLLKLGIEQVTTHRRTGGSGIGFMTTFETLKECKASLKIEEFTESKYTKAIKIIFDGANEYRIKSYRTNEIKKQNKDNRIIFM